MDDKWYCQSHLCKRWNPWISCKKKDDSFMNEYRKWTNAVTNMIKGWKREYFTDVSNSTHPNPRSLWTELGSIIHNISYPRSISNPSLKIWVPMSFIYNSKTSLTRSVPQLQETYHYYGRARKVYIRSILKIFSVLVSWRSQYRYRTRQLWIF